MRTISPTTRIYATNWHTYIDSSVMKQNIKKIKKLKCYDICYLEFNLLHLTGTPLWYETKGWFSGLGFFISFREE